MSYIWEGINVLVLLSLESRKSKPENAGFNPCIFLMQNLIINHNKSKKQKNNIKDIGAGALGLNTHQLCEE